MATYKITIRKGLLNHWPYANILYKRGSTATWYSGQDLDCDARGPGSNPGSGMDVVYIRRSYVLLLVGQPCFLGPCPTVLIFPSNVLLFRIVLFFDNQNPKK